MMHTNYDSLDLMKFRNSYAYSAFYMLDTVLASLCVLIYWVFPTTPEVEILTVPRIGKLRHISPSRSGTAPLAALETPIPGL